MIRLFKLIFFIVILSGAYFSYKSHNESADSTRPWYPIITQQKIQIQFPIAPKHTKKIRDLPIIGQSNLQIYQQQTDKELFVYIELRTRNQKLNKLKLNQLETAVHTVNGTDDLKITNKHFFSANSQSIMDYVAHDTNGNLIYCRTYKLDGMLVSLIYASQADQFNKKRHKQFFNSLQL